MVWHGCVAAAPMTVFEFLRFESEVVPWSAGVWPLLHLLCGNDLFCFVFNLFFFFGVSCSVKERLLFGGEGKDMATFG